MDHCFKYLRIFMAATVLCDTVMVALFVQTHRAYKTKREPSTVTVDKKDVSVGH